MARHNAARCVIVLLLTARQEVTKNRAKGSAFGNRAVRAKTVDAPRQQCFCENGQIQILRLHFDVKMQTDKARLFTILVGGRRLVDPF
jgi:hypothetical protein